MLTDIQPDDAVEQSVAGAILRHWKLARLPRHELRSQTNPRANKGSECMVSANTQHGTQRTGTPTHLWHPDASHWSCSAGRRSARGSGQRGGDGARGEQAWCEHRRHASTTMRLAYSRG